MRLAVLSVLALALPLRSEEGFCSRDECSSDGEILVLYDVNPPEGFNLRRDVYLRMAGLVLRSPRPLRLVLPPWGRLFHWRRKGARPSPWALFFDVTSLQAYIPVVEFETIARKGSLRIDTIYRLTHFEDAFEDGRFVEKWKFRDESFCKTPLEFWGFNVTAENVECVAFQGTASKLLEIINSHPSDSIVMFTNAEIALHDEYNTAEYWHARKSMKFNKDLIAIADEYINKELNCNTIKCKNYLSVHWRRADFARSRGDAVPSIKGTAQQIMSICKELDLNKVFIATDADWGQFNHLKDLLEGESLEVRYYTPTDEVEAEFKEGGIAIIDQIICSRSAHFVGTYESTFTYRIQEEREIMGFDSDSTFNRLCPDKGPCEKPTRWKIVN